MPEKVGYIFECERGGPDYQVCQCFLSRVHADVVIEPAYLSMPSLLVDCGPTAAELLRTCSRVIIQWDYKPLWKRPRSCIADRETIEQSLAANGVPLDRVTLICVKAELEAWLLADHHAVEGVVHRLKKNVEAHPIQRFKRHRKPHTVPYPKKVLEDYFMQELGKGRKYQDVAHALPLA